MLMLVDCSNCHTPLQLPPGAKSILCAICHAVTVVADPRTFPATPPQASAASSPYNHAPAGSLAPSFHGSKRAVICGVSYKNTRHELKGCVNDARCMKYLLVNKFCFPESSILMLTGTSYFYFFSF